MTYHPPLTAEEVNSRLALRGFTLLTPFVSSKGHATLRCSDGHEWRAYMGGVLKKNGTGCPHCAGVARLTLDEIDRRLTPRGITRMCENTRTKGESRFRCAHGHEWATVLSAVLQGNGCPACSSTRPLTTDEVADRIKHRGISVLDQVVSCNHRVRFKCDKGHVWHAKPGNVLDGKGCPHCYREGWVTTQSLNERIAHRGLRAYGEVSNVNTRVDFECQCGYRWNTVVASVLRGTGCANCAQNGFNPQAPAHLYTLRLLSEGGQYVGFGITKDVKKRMATHRTYLKKQGFACEVIATYRFESGEDARAMENILKESLPRVDIGVRGFRKETIPVYAYNDMLRILEALAPCD